MKTLKIDMPKKSLALALRSPVVWLFGVLYTLALVYLIAAHRPILLLVALYGLLTLGLTLVIVTPLTTKSSPPYWQEPLSSPRWKVWCQLGIIGAYLVWVYFLSYYAFAPFLPYISFIMQRVVVFFLEVVIPVLGVLLLGASWKDIGLGSGTNVWKVAGALALIPLIFLGISIVFRLQSLQYVLVAMMYVLFSIGIPEEVGFRGILMTRMTRSFNAQWGMILSSLLFALIHFQANQTYFSVALPDAIAVCIVFDMVIGLALAIIAQRTSSILACVIFHVLFDVVSFALLALYVPGK